MAESPFKKSVPITDFTSRYEVSVPEGRSTLSRCEVCEHTGESHT
jgi:hypothetical protein